MRTFQGQAEGAEVVWFRVPDDTPFLPFPHKMTARIWEPDKTNDQCGEDCHLDCTGKIDNQPWYNGHAPAPYLGGYSWCGTLDSWLNCADPAVTPPLPILPDGMCAECPQPDFVTAGGIAKGGSGVMSSGSGSGCQCIFVVDTDVRWENGCLNQYQATACLNIDSVTGCLTLGPSTWAFQKQITCCSGCGTVTIITTGGCTPGVCGLCQDPPYSWSWTQTGFTGAAAVFNVLWLLLPNGSCTWSQTQPASGGNIVCTITLTAQAVAVSFVYTDSSGAVIASALYSGPPPGLPNCCLSITTNLVDCYPQGQALPSPPAPTYDCNLCDTTPATWSVPITGMTGAAAPFNQTWTLVQTNQCTWQATQTIDGVTYNVNLGQILAEGTAFWELNCSANYGIQGGEVTYFSLGGFVQFVFYDCCSPINFPAPLQTSSSAGFNLPFGFSGSITCTPSCASNSGSGSGTCPPTTTVVPACCSTIVVSSGSGSGSGCIPGQCNPLVCGNPPYLWTIPVTGFQGAAAIFNGSWALVSVGDCVWQATANIGGYSVVVGLVMTTMGCSLQFFASQGGVVQFSASYTSKPISPYCCSELRFTNATCNVPPPVVGEVPNCPNCIETPSGFTVVVAGGTGCWANLNQTYTLTPIAGGGGCIWAANIPFGTGFLTCTAFVYNGGLNISLADTSQPLPFAVGALYSDTTGTFAAENCCTPLSLPLFSQNAISCTAGGAPAPSISQVPQCSLPNCPPYLVAFASCCLPGGGTGSGSGSGINTICCPNPTPATLVARFGGGTGGAACLDGLVVTITSLGGSWTNNFPADGCGFPSECVLNLDCYGFGAIWQLSSTGILTFVANYTTVDCSPFQLTFLNISVPTVGGTINCVVTPT